MLPKQARYQISAQGIAALKNRTELLTFCHPKRHQNREGEKRVKSKREKGEGKAGTSAVDPMQADHRTSFPSMLSQGGSKGKGSWA